MTLQPYKQRGRTAHNGAGEENPTRNRQQQREEEDAEHQQWFPVAAKSVAAPRGWKIEQGKNKTIILSGYK